MTKLDNAISNESTQVSIIRITPLYAAELLKTNNNIRPINKEHVQFLYKQMESGNWQFGNDAIVLDHNGNLVNGQHRLTALVQYGKPLEFLVMQTSNPKSIRIFDSGKHRTHSDVISKHAVKNLDTITAVTRGYIYALKGYKRFQNNIPITNVEFEDSFIKHQDDLLFITAIRTPVRPLLSKIVYGFISYHILDKYGKEALKEFIYDLGYGYKMYGATQNAAVCLYNQILNSKNNKEQIRNDIMAALVLKTFNLWNKRKSVPNSIRWSVLEPYPEI
jgi:hypothetical protein